MTIHKRKKRKSRKNHVLLTKKEEGGMKGKYRSYLNEFLSLAIDLNDSNRMGTINKIDDEMVFALKLNIQSARTDK